MLCIYTGARRLRVSFVLFASSDGHWCTGCVTPQCCKRDVCRGRAHCTWCYVERDLRSIFKKAAEATDISESVVSNRKHTCTHIYIYIDATHVHTRIHKEKVARLLADTSFRSSPNSINSEWRHTARMKDIRYTLRPLILFTRHVYINHDPPLWAS